jgi:hypothetical protein
MLSPASPWQSFLITLKQPNGLPIWELLILLFFCCSISYMLSKFSLDTILRDILWENAACRLPALFLFLAWSWTITIFTCERAKLNLESIFGGPVLNSAELFSVCKGLSYAFVLFQTLDMIFTGRFIVSLVCEWNKMFCS